jgi:hypothetical protein
VQQSPPPTGSLGGGSARAVALLVGLLASLSVGTGVHAGVRIAYDSASRAAALERRAFASEIIVAGRVLMAYSDFLRTGSRRYPIHRIALQVDAQLTDGGDTVHIFNPPRTYVGKDRFLDSLRSFVAEQTGAALRARCDVELMGSAEKIVPPPWRGHSIGPPVAAVRVSRAWGRAPLPAPGTRVALLLAPKHSNGVPTTTFPSGRTRQELVLFVDAGQEPGQYRPLGSWGAAWVVMGDRCAIPCTWVFSDPDPNYIRWRSVSDLIP